MAISLSAGVRQSLQSLNSTAALAQTSQNRLATGKKVNSAIDNPTNFFTAAGLNNRADAFSGLLDGISNSIQTIKAASNGIDGITKLVKSLQSTIKQAQSDAATNNPVINSTTAPLATGAEVTATNKSLQDIALDKAIFGADATADAATATTAGDVGIDTSTNTSVAVSVSAGNTTFQASLSAGATVRDLVNTINSSGLASASVDSNGKLTIKGSGSDTLKVGIGSGATDAAAKTDAAAGTLNTKLGLVATDASAGIAATGNSSVRANLVQQFNDVRTQLDQLAKDSGFNGTNLLGGDKLKVVFNEKTGSNQSKLDVQGSTVSSANLGIVEASNGAVAGNVNFQNDSSLAAASDSLTNALSSLSSLSSTLGASLSVVQTRQDFSKSLIDTLKIGADNLVNADTNEEGANLLALQTRQQLSQTALSMSAQADQAVLRLF
ncbi:flagellin [Enterovirga rhinocerotis]|uniref:Flagellin n=1 Tax=Enterovirga rhinocerotis TaxID=1339210 RepID=A0A4R7C421_9HYPH|nr:flagellin [Enterovirga rhinocerotis]TDR93148.1 flagellin-like hook-associated protein FlgL [Enterovirga rhinocerotis]